VGFTVVKSETTKKFDKELYMVNKELKEAYKELQLENQGLRENNEVYKQFFDNPLNGFVSYKIITDNKGIPVDFVYLEINRAFENLTGLKRENILNKKLSEAIPPEEAAELIKIYGKAALKYKKSHLEHYRPSINKYFEIFTFSPHKNRLISFFIDITQRKKAEDEIIKLNKNLNQRIEELTTLYELLPMSVAITQDKDCKTMYANPVMEELLGITPGSNMSLSSSSSEKPNFKAYLNGRELPPEELPIQKAIATGKPVIGSEFDIIRNDGRIVDFYGHAVPLFDRGGNIRGAIGAFDDITERKRAEEKLKSTMIELKRSNQELEQFAYVASHDLQEPLRMVSSFTQLLAKQYKDQLDENAKEYINYAVDGAKRMQQLINDLLLYSRVNTQGDKFEDINLEKVLDEVLYNLEIVIQENQAIITREPLPKICADYRQMSQLFQNLIGNALKYRSEETPKISISVQKKEENWLFMVKDNGIGMEPKYHEQVFQIFRRLHSPDDYEGTGIGLAIAKRIIERHHGQIWVKSEPRKGSTFYFTIPITL
jgi:PAS domain S-box-containing protein